MTAQEWEHLTLLMGEILDHPQQESAILEREPAEVRAQLHALLAEHRAADSTPEKRVIANRYELLRLLNSGGNGEAWLSLDARTGHQVVLKNWESFREDLTQRFLAEAEILRRLDHPAIVAMLETGSTPQGAPFLVMPCVEGITLRERLDRGPIIPAEAASIVEQLGSALAAAHRQSIIHRDLKPENIILQDSRDEIRAILIDFGIALSSSENSAGTTTSFFGTTRYMAPEQLMGKPELGSDVYALALVVYEMLSGQPLFSSVTPVGLFQEQQGFREARLQALPYSVRYALHKGLQWKSERRPAVDAFATELAAAVREWGGHWRPSRRAVIVSLGMAAPLAAWSGYEMRPLSAAEKSVTYKAGQTYTEVGWRKMGTVDADVTILDNVNQTVVGNRLVSSDQGSYAKTLPERVRRAGLKRAWRFTGYVIPKHGSCHFAVGFLELGVGFLMAAVIPDNGSPFISAPLTYSPRISGKETAATFAKDRMTKMEMMFDPASQSASIAVDDRVLITGYIGRHEYVGQAVGVGFSAYQSKIAEGIFGDTRFVML